VFVRLNEYQTVREPPSLIEHMARDLSRQATGLEEVRLQMFLDWLQCHCCTIQIEQANAREIQHQLGCWLETFSPDDLYVEYRLIMNEIAWWRNAADPAVV
jgi:hypothetical protein